MRSLAIATLSLLAACEGAGPRQGSATSDPSRSAPPAAAAAPSGAPESPASPDAARAASEPMPESPDEIVKTDTTDKIEKTDAEWRALLTPEEYRVARQAGTERPFTGRYWNTETAGTYHCVCCGAPLFRSDAKFESGCGWPSFFEPLADANLVELRDTTLGMLRTEIRCRRCDAHLGHVFDDGPPPTGLRYCINSVSLKLDPDEGAGGEQDE